MLLGPIVMLLVGCHPSLAGSGPLATRAERLQSFTTTRSEEIARSRSEALPVVRRSRHSSEPDPREQAERDAAAIFRSMHSDVLACYTKRLATHPKAHAAITIEVLVGQDGRPRDVATTGGALLGSAVLSCVTRKVMRTAFTPPRDGGSSRVRVPFAFHPDDADDDG